MTICLDDGIIVSLYCNHATHLRVSYGRLGTSHVHNMFGIFESGRREGALQATWVKASGMFVSFWRSDIQDIFFYVKVLLVLHATIGLPCLFLLGFGKDI